MKTMEWTNVDRTGWPSGQWDGEPDKVQWQDQATGYPCLAVRHRFSGHWCGYVGVQVGHPAYEKGYDEVAVKNEDGEDTYPDVHGELTFADRCQPGEDHGKGVCHLPEPGESDSVWWLGFDCAHCDDYGPRDAVYARDRSEECFSLSYRRSYRTLDYVKSQCAGLAKQLHGAANG